MPVSIPELLVEPGPAEPPPEPACEVWRDTSGVPIAHGWIGSDGMRMSFPGLGLYRFSLDGPVFAHRSGGAPVHSLTGTYWKSVIPFVLQARGLEVLHASAIATTGGVVAFCAVSETGKSTLARALGRRGHRPWADDSVVLDGARALPLRFQVKLRPASSNWFGEPDLSRFEEPHGELPLRAIFLLERAGSGITCSRIGASAAFPHLLRHAFCFSLSDPARTRAMVERYLALASAVPVFELRFPDGLHHLDAISARIERTIAELDRLDHPAANS